MSVKLRNLQGHYRNVVSGVLCTNWIILTASIVQIFTDINGEPDIEHPAMLVFENIKLRIDSIKIRRYGYRHYRNMKVNDFFRMGTEECQNKAGRQSKK